jgi:DNA-binding NarL/FixJ family response regulator
MTVRVLLVDDHALFRTGLRRSLETERDITPVGEAGTAEQALVKARALQPDLVLLDLILPRGSFPETIAELLKTSPRSKVLVVSSEASPGAVRRAISAGASGYVTKRASGDELVAAMRSIAAGERYVEPQLGAKLVLGDDVPALEPLSEREREVLELLVRGHTNQEIGKTLYISVRTVDTHRAHIMRKLRLETRAELVLFALANGLLGAAG